MAPLDLPDAPTTKLLLRAPNPVGDLIMWTPALKAIRRRFPLSAIDLLTGPAGARLLPGLPYFRQLLVEERGGAGSKRSLLEQLRRERYGCAVLFTNSFSSAFLLWRARIPRRVGYRRSGRGALLTHPIEPERQGRRYRPLPMVDYYLRLCDELGCATDDRLTKLVVTEEDRSKAAAVLERNGVSPSSLVVALVVGAGYGSAKLWVDEYFAHVADRLVVDYGATVLLLGGPGDLRVARRIENLMTQRAVNLVPEGPGLDVAKGLVERSSLMITTDSGPRHIGVALGKPVIVLIGSADPVYSTPFSGVNHILREEVECSPCMRRHCPIDHRCMTRLKPERVLRSVSQLLGAPSGGGVQRLDLLRPGRDSA